MINQKMVIVGNNKSPANRLGCYLKELIKQNVQSSCPTSFLRSIEYSAATSNQPMGKNQHRPNNM